MDVLNLIEELKKHHSLFRKLGGHAKAAGFSLADGITPDILSACLNQFCSLTEDMLHQKKWIDMQLPFQYISESLIKELELLEPFGFMNERPVFAERNVKVNRISVLGKRTMLKLQLENETDFVSRQPLRI